MPTDNKLWIPSLSPKDQKKINRRQRSQRLVKWTGFPEKTLWDWLQLLSVLAIPVVIAAGTLWFTAQQSETNSQASDKQHQTDLQIANDQQQEDALQTYLDRMSDLLLNNKLHESKPGDEVRNVARARTLTILPQLNGTRKRELVQFLYEAGLIDHSPLNVIIDLNSADLSYAFLSYINLSGANLSAANLFNANLRGADIIASNLFIAYLQGANLRGAILSHTDLRGADLSDANLNYATLNYADFRGADLSDANLRNADFRSANLYYTNLRGADLSNAIVSPEQLRQAKSLKGAIMPDGSIHP